MDRDSVVVDIGNSLMKLALFAAEAADELPRPVRVTRIAAEISDFSQLDAWLPNAPLQWLIGSVQAQTLQHLTSWLSVARPGHSLHVLTYADFPLPLMVTEPAALGIDRLAGALAANALREPDKAAIVVDAGSAITIDVVNATGVFVGGTISPGLQLRLDAMHHGTDKLPLLAMPMEAPRVIGSDTESAMLAGAFWSAATGIDGLISRFIAELDSAANVFLTGGSAELLSPHLESEHRYEPHLVLSGLAMAKR